MRCGSRCRRRCCRCWPSRASVRAPWATAWRELGIDTPEAFAAAARAGRLRELPGFGPRTEARILAGLEQADGRPTAPHAHRRGAGPRRTRHRGPGVGAGRALRDGLRLPAAALRDRRRPGRADRDGPAGSRPRGARHAAVVGPAGGRPPGRRPRPAQPRAAGRPAARRHDHCRRRRSAAPWSTSRARRRTTWPFGTGRGRWAGPSPSTAWLPAGRRGGRGPHRSPPRPRSTRPWDCRTSHRSCARDRASWRPRRRVACPASCASRTCSGDCHSHTDWSDGREPLEVMVDSARAAGRRYQVLTDHSWSLGIANGLSPARVEQQRRVIGELNERFARQEAAGDAARGRRIRRASGSCTAASWRSPLDGRLDYDDALLARFDVVVASLHVGRRQPRAQLMARYELAMRSPHVDIISHPSGRKIGQRPDLDLDWEAFYRAGRGDRHAAGGQRQRGSASTSSHSASARRAMPAAASSSPPTPTSAPSGGTSTSAWPWPGVAGWRPTASPTACPSTDFLALMRDKPHRLPA